MKQRTLAMINGFERHSRKTRQPLGPHVRLMNLIHRHVKNGKFQRVHVWMSGENVRK